MLYYVDIFSVVDYRFCYFAVYLYFFFFKQKTAYEMRISDWSSDVCSSDLRAGPGQIARRRGWSSVQSRRWSAGWISDAMEARWPSGTHGPIRQRQAVADGPAQTFRDCGCSGVVAGIAQPTGESGNAQSLAASLRFGGFVQSCPTRSEEHT